MSCRRVMAIGSALLVGLSGCGSDTPRLSADAVHRQVGTACDQHADAYRHGVHATAGDTFTADSLDEVSAYDTDAYKTISTVRGPADQRAQLDILYASIQDLASAKASARNSLEERDWAKAQESIDQGRAAATAVDAGAASLDLAGCGAATWVGTWFDEAQTYLDSQVEATKPTGDFVTDVQTACDRLYTDVADAPLPLGGVDTQLWALSLRDALGLFIRDVEALDVPEGKQPIVDELKATIDELQANLGKLVSAVPGGTSDPDALIGSIQQGIDDLRSSIDALGANC